MSSTRIPLSLRLRLRTPTTQPFTSSPRNPNPKTHLPNRRMYSTEHPQQSSQSQQQQQPHSSSIPKEPSRVGSFYRTFSYPILKAFLGALFTYQLAYYLWLKLEVAEEKYNKKQEIRGLTEELKEVVAEKKREAQGKVGEVVEKVEEKAKGKGWKLW